MTKVGTFEGFPFFKNEDGYFWKNGRPYGYFDIAAECKDSIAEFNRSGDDENIYGLATIRQSIEEDRRR